VRRSFAAPPLRQRVIALAAAYAIALAGLIASFGAAQATAEATAAGAGTGIICHSDTGEAAPPTGSHESNGAICFKSCIGCVTSSLATIMPPAVAAAGPPWLSFRRLDLPAHPVRVLDAKANAHRSRGPPPAL
jgi:hypothetical protein